MLDYLEIPADETTPHVVLDPAKGTISISGVSFPEDASTTFAPVDQWIKDYLAQPCDQTTLIFNLEYFNSATSRFLAATLVALEDLIDQGKSVTLEWHYDAEDDVMYDRGEELSLVVNIPFEFIPSS